MVDKTNFHIIYKAFRELNEKMQLNKKVTDNRSH